MSSVPSYDYKEFLVRRIVVHKLVDRRLGFESDDPPEGWKWDMRYVTNLETKETLPRPGIKKSHLLSIPPEYWQNGPATGKKEKSLELENIIEQYLNGQNQWTPKLNSGPFNISKDPYYLFSDNSVGEKYSPSNLDSNNRSYHVLSKQRETGTPIKATIYKRTDQGQIVPWRDYEHRQQFSSVPDSDGNQQITRLRDTIYWSKVNTNLRELITYIRDEGEYIQFNRDVTENVTSTSTPTLLSDFNNLSYVGSTDGTDNQILYLKHFPVDTSSLKVYAVNVSAGTWVSYPIVTTFTGSSQVKLDPDIGKLTFGSGANTPGAGLGIYVSYKAVPRIEYEERSYPLTRTLADINLNPISQTNNQGFLLLSRTELDIGSIVLSTSELPYKGLLDTYGPVYAGSDYAPLYATVYSPSGNPISNVEVTFSIETTPITGSLGSAGTSIQGITDSAGVAKTWYSSPNSANDMGYYVLNLNTSNSLYIPGIQNLTDLDDIYTYRVLKDDPWLGKEGANTSLGEVSWSTLPPNGRKVVLYEWSSEAIHPITGHKGAYTHTKPASVSNGILTYSSALDTPDPDGSLGYNLGCYWVVAPQHIAIRASVYSSKIGKTIYSNRIYIRLELPEYMKGTYVSDTLNKTIPFGYRVIDDKYEVASAFGGATYISINPVAGPYPIVDVIAGETWDPYSGDGGFWPYDTYPSSGASRPFGIIGLFCKVI